MAHVCAPSATSTPGKYSLDSPQIGQFGTSIAAVTIAALMRRSVTSAVCSTGRRGCGSARRRSGVAGCFLDELYAGAQAEFGVDVGEVGLHCARLDEQPGGDVVVGQPVADQSHDVALGGGERCPAAGGAFALAAAALRVGDRLLGGQAPALGPRAVKVLLAQGVSQRRH